MLRSASVDSCDFLSFRFKKHLYKIDQQYCHLEQTGERQSSRTSFAGEGPDFATKKEEKSGSGGCVQYRVFGEKCSVGVKKHGQLEACAGELVEGKTREELAVRRKALRQCCYGQWRAVGGGTRRIFSGICPATRIRAQGSVVRISICTRFFYSGR